MKKNEKFGKLQGIKTGASRGKTKKTKYLCDSCQWYVGCTWCKDGKKSVCDGYKPYNTDYEYPSFDGIDYLFSKPLGDADNNNKVKFNFRKQLTQFFSNTFVGRFIGVTMPKKILLECGIPNLPIIIRPVQLKEKIIKHNLTKDVIKNLNTSINAPLLVFRSLTKIGTFNVIIEKQNEEGIICVSLHPNKEIDKIEVTEIASIHGRNLDQLINWCENNALLYGNSNKTKKVLICSQFNSTKSEYLMSLIDNTKVVKEFIKSNNSQENLQGCKASEYFKIPIATDIATLENGIDEILKNYSGRDMAAYQAEKYLKESIDISNEWLKKKSLKRREDFKKWCANRQAKLRKTVLQQRREDMAKLNVDRILEEAKIQNIEYMIKNGQGTFAFAEHIKELYCKGEKMDWLKAKKIAKYFGISSETEIMQSCELAIVLESRRIAQNGNSIRQQYEELKDLYERQVNIKPLDTKSKVLQQYSTPCPLAYLLGKFILPKNYDYKYGFFLEPSAGNGMLTIALPKERTIVNEIDEIRVENLKRQGFKNVLNLDASKETKSIDVFIGIITNPPFGKLERKEQISRNGWDINTLDYKMAVLALDRMQDEGKAAIIVGGKMWNNYWKPLSERSEKQVLFGQWKTFLGYLYAQYNVVDVIYIDGENIYRKQGTQYPIVVILVDGRHEYNESNKPNYVFDKNRDKILTTFDQIFDRIFPYLENNDKENEKRAKALFFKMKMQSVNFPSLGNNDDDDIFKKYTDFIKEALSSKTHSRIECTELISEHSKRIVNRLLKKNINKYYLTADDIRHSRNVHGKVTEYLKNQIPITELDFIRIPEILYSPTNIDLSNPNTKNGQGIRFVKEYTDGKIFCVMIDEYETEELSVKTNYKKPPLQGIDVLPKAAPKHNVRNARALPMLNANVVNFFRIK